MNIIERRKVKLTIDTFISICKKIYFAVTRMAIFILSLLVIIIFFAMIFNSKHSHDTCGSDENTTNECKHKKIKNINIKLDYDYKTIKTK